jgi:putative transposase
MVKAESTAARTKFREEAERMGRGLVFDSAQQAHDWIMRVHADFNDRPHRALPKIFDAHTNKKRHRTPHEEWTMARAEQSRLGPQEWCAVMLSDEDIADLFRVREPRIVVRGRVSIYGQDYAHADLEHWNGKSVFVAYDRHDGTRVWVEDAQGRLIVEAPFCKSRDYRTRSVYEIVLDKRADAQIKRLEKKADAIQARRPTFMIDQRTGAPLVPLVIEDPAPELLNNIVNLPTAAREQARPMFDSDAEMYRWLKANPADITAFDRDWIDGYRRTGEYQDLFAEREARDQGNDREVAAG